MGLPVLTGVVRVLEPLLRSVAGVFSSCQQTQWVGMALDGESGVMSDVEEASALLMHGSCGQPSQHK